MGPDVAKISFAVGLLQICSVSARREKKIKIRRGSIARRFLLKYIMHFSSDQTAVHWRMEAFLGVYSRLLGHSTSLDILV